MYAYVQFCCKVPEFAHCAHLSNAKHLMQIINNRAHIFIMNHSERDYVLRKKFDIVQRRCVFHKQHVIIRVISSYE